MLIKPVSSRNMIHLKNLTCDNDSTNYVSNLEYYGSDDVTKINIEINTGVSSQILIEILPVAYPNLKSLTIKQCSFNTAISKVIPQDSITESTNTQDIVSLVKALHLSNFSLAQTSTKMFDGVNIDEFFRKLPNDCTYYIFSGDLQNPADSVTHIDPSHGKFMVFGR